ncbi:MAG: hypothetical protein DKINENOH_01867 [bacterium]|nr:hypothetical protein [bacterium]
MRGRRAQRFSARLTAMLRKIACAATPLQQYLFPVKNKMRILPRLSAAVLVFLLGHAARLHPQILPFQLYSLKNGLSSVWITSILQDSRGYLWVTSDEGVSVYDGVRFRNYTVGDGLPVSHVWSIHESRRAPGTMWIGTHGAGVVKMQNGKFTSRRLGARPGANTVSTMYEDERGILWCGTNNGVYQVLADSVRPFLADSSQGWVPFIAPTRDGLIWISTMRGLFRYQPQTGATQPLDLHLGAEIPVCLVEEEAGDLWLATHRGLVCRVRGDRVIAKRQLPVAEVNGMLADGEGGLWITSSSGIVRLAREDFATGALTHYSVANGLPEITVIACLRDRENNLWFGGRTRGLFKLAERHYFTFPFENLRADVMNRAAVVDRRGRLFLLTPEGVWEIWQPHLGNWQTVLHRVDRAHLTGRLWQADFGADSTLWIGYNDGGLCGYAIHANGNQPSRLQRTQVLRPGRELPAGFPIAFHIDHENQLWCSLRGTGLAHVDLRGPVRRGFYSIEKGLPEGTIRAIWRDRHDRLWLGGFGNGITIYRVEQDTLRFERKLTKTEGLPDDGIRMIAEHSNGEIWIATRMGGAGVYRDGQIQILSTREGLLSNAVWGFAEDEEGRMWLATSLGMQYYTPAPQRTLHTPQPLSGQYFGSIGVAPGGMIWGVSYNELVVYQNRDRHATSAPPLIYLTNLRVNGKNQTPAPELEFSHDQNLCTIEFNGISFKDEAAVRYRYRLRGLHENWQDPTDQRVVTFASLRPGTYTFEVMALNAEGVASVQPASLTFTIQPPFWQRWWFLTFCAVLLASILYAVHVVRLDRLLAIEKIRSRIALDLHDDIGAGLTHIGLLSQVALHKKSVQRFLAQEAREGNAAAAPEAELQAAALQELAGSLTRVGEVARELSAAMSDVVWSINPKHDSVEALQRRLKAFAGEVCSARNIALQFEVTRQLAGSKLHAEVRRNLLLIAKEALHNTTKYSGSPSVSVKIGANGNQLVVEIADQGRGFDPALAREGNGLHSMRSRAEKLGGTCEILTAPGQGTRIVAQVPYRN